MSDQHFEHLPANPFVLFKDWFEAGAKTLSSGPHAEPTAMTLATSTPDGFPSARVVLLKSYDEKGFVFYTNYQSRKSKEMLLNPKASLVFYYPALARQIRVEGTLSKTAPHESDAYFESRPRESQLGAWASAQSSEISGRAELQAKLDHLRKKFDGHAIPRPDFWGGFRLSPLRIEFWQGRDHRLHDRMLYRLNAKNEWEIVQLSP